MNVETIKEEFRRRITEQIDLEPQGADRFQVITPFRFEDGDHFVITLRRENDGWLLSDEANTILHLSYWMETDVLQSGNRREIIDSSLSLFAVEDRDGELVMPISGDQFGDALFDFVQALTKVTDISFLSRERVRSTFMEDLASFIKRNVPEDRLQINWKHEDDPNGRYKVDFYVNSMKKPLLIFGLPNDDKTQLATISLLKFRTWGMPFQSLGIYEEQEEISPKDVARFTDAVDKSYSSLRQNESDIAAYLTEVLHKPS
jgi:hypothetical protein